MKSSERSDFQRGDAVDGVIHGAGGAGEVEDVIDCADVKGLANVFFYKFKARVVREVSDVTATASQQVVDNNHAVAFAKESVTEMRSQKAGAAGDQCALLVHGFLVPFLRGRGTPSGWEAARPTE